VKACVRNVTANVTAAMSVRKKENCLQKQKDGKKRMKQVGKRRKCAQAIRF